jgi:hypothetical protein
MVAKGRSKEAFDHVNSLVKEEVFHTPRATMSTIVLAVSKTFIFELLNEDGEGIVEVIIGDKLRQVMDKFIVLFSPNIHNLVASFKHQPRNKRYIFNIFFLKANNGYCFNHDNYFPRQQNGKKMFPFKMFVHGNGRGYDLIKRM